MRLLATTDNYAMEAYISNSIYILPEKYQQFFFASCMEQPSFFLKFNSNLYTARVLIEKLLVDHFDLTSEISEEASDQPR